MVRHALWSGTESGFDSGLSSIFGLVKANIGKAWQEFHLRRLRGVCKSVFWYIEDARRLSHRFSQFQILNRKPGFMPGETNDLGRSGRLGASEELLDGR